MNYHIDELEVHWDSLPDKATYTTVDRKGLFMKVPVFSSDGEREPVVSGHRVICLHRMEECDYDRRSLVVPVKLDITAHVCEVPACSV